jgi:hypothetical protein
MMQAGRKIQASAPDAMDTVRAAIREGKTSISTATVKFRQGDFQGAAAALDAATDRFDEALRVLQRTTYAARR